MENKKVKTATFQAKAPFDIAKNINGYEVSAKDRETAPHNTTCKAQFEFACRLGNLIQDQGKTLKEISEKTGIKTSSLSNYCTGASEPGINAAYKLANELNVTIDYLLGISDAKKINENIRTACKVSTLSEAAIVKLKEYVKGEPALRSAIQNYLIESGFFKKLADNVETLMIDAYQFNLLYMDNDKEEVTIFQQQEYRFSKAMTALYRKIIDDLQTQLRLEIEETALLQIDRLEATAQKTMDKMKSILDRLQTPEVQAAYANLLMERL